MEQSYNLAQRILVLREKKNYTQSFVAEQIEVSRTTYTKWETGMSEPSATQLIKLAKLFGVSTDYLCGNIEQKGETIAVIDTCVILDRPKILELLIKIYDKVIIPSVVIRELNDQKDYGKGTIKQKAWLGMVTIENNKEKLIIAETEYIKGANNDELIMSVAKKYALDNLNNKVHVLTNDVYFSLQHASSGIRNLAVKQVKDIEKLLYKDDQFDEFNTQRFISEVKNKKLYVVKNMDLTTVNVNRRDSSTGMTPLIIAIRNKDYGMVEYLVSLKQIDLEQRDDYKYGFTPLLHCCQLKDVRLMKILIENGADINSSSRGKNKGNTPLMVCTWGGFNDGIKLLMESEQLSYNQQDFNGFTALHKGCIKNNYEGLKLLIDKVDRKIEDFNNKKAVEYLQTESHYFERIKSLFSK